MKKLLLASVALGAAMAQPGLVQALSVSVLWDASRDTGADWLAHVEAGLSLSLGADTTITLTDHLSYDGAEGFTEALASASAAADVVVTDFVPATDALAPAADADRPLLINLAPGNAKSCHEQTIHLAGDVALGRLAAIYMNGIKSQRTFAFVKDDDEGKKRLGDFRRAFTGGLGGAAFAKPDQTDFRNEVAILKVTQADGAYFDLEGQPLYDYLEAAASGNMTEAVNAVTTSDIDYDRLSEETRSALAAMTLVSAWNPDTVDAQPFKEAFRDAMGEDPAFSALMGYEAGLVLSLALDGPSDNLFSNVISTAWQSPRGPVSFDEHGYAIVPVGAYKFTETALSLKGRIAVPTDHDC